MIIGIGIDLLEIARMEKACQTARFLEKVFTEQERNKIKISGMQSAAGIFCAKEAAMKALGTGMRVSFQDIEITNLPSGKPILTFSGKAEAMAQELGGASTFVSISHSEQTATAMVVLEGIL